MDDKNQNNTSSTPGLVVLGCIAVSAASLFIGIISAVNENDFVGAGVCLIASALSVGLLANAVWRK